MDRNNSSLLILTPPDTVLSTLFLDDGGVLNNNRIRGREWKRLVPAYFIPRYGGTEKQWAQANGLAAQKIMNRIKESYNLMQQQLPAGYHQQEDYEWLVTMFEYLRLELPQDVEAESQHARAWICERVNSAYPGIKDIIPLLAERYALYTASNEVSFELLAYLKGMGIAHHFTEFYGSDLIGALKTSPFYYQQLAELTAVNPSEAVIIDDNPQNLKYAKEVGFHTILSRQDGQNYQYPYAFEHGHQLPRLIEELS